MPKKESRRHINQKTFGTERHWLNNYKADLKLSYNEIQETDGVYIHSNISTFNNTYESLVGERQSFIGLLNRTVQNFAKENAAVIGKIKNDTENFAKLFDMTVEQLQSFIQDTLKAPDSYAIKIPTLKETISMQEQSNEFKGKDSKAVKDIIKKQIIMPINAFAELFEKIVNNNFATEDKERYRSELNKLLAATGKLGKNKYEQGLYKELRGAIMQSLGWLQEPAVAYSLVNGKVKSEKIVIEKADAIGSALGLTDVVLSVRTPSMENISKIGLNIKSSSTKYQTRRTGVDPQDFWGDNEIFKSGSKIAEYLYWNKAALDSWSTKEMRRSKTTKEESYFAVEVNYASDINAYIANALAQAQRVYYTAWLYSTMVSNDFSIEKKNMTDVLNKKYEEYKTNNNIINYFVVLGTNVESTYALYDKMNKYYSSSAFRPSTFNPYKISPEALKMIYSNKKRIMKEEKSTGKVSNDYNALLGNSDLMSQMKALVEVELLRFFNRKTELVYNFRSIK